MGRYLFLLIFKADDCGIPGHPAVSLSLPDFVERQTAVKLAKEVYTESSAVPNERVGVIG
jgi:hypothetical protein